MPADRSCLYCGGWFSPPRGVGQPGRGMFCSRECSFHSKVSPEVVPGGCWEWIGSRDVRGYGIFTWAGVTERAHRVALELVGAKVPDELSALHSCDNPPCCRPIHLYADTHAENMKDSSRKGRMHFGASHGLRKHPECRARGSRHGNAKLDEAAVRHIRHLAVNGSVSHRQIAKVFGVSFQTISKIVRGQLWAHLDQGDRDAEPSRLHLEVAK